MEVELKEITKLNWEKIAHLSLLDSQKYYLFDNSYSIAESFFCENSVTRAIYSGENAIGFLMYESLNDEGKPEEVELLRFMIDAKYQGKGFGRKAFKAAIENIKSRKCPKRIHICFHKENFTALNLYKSVGFTDNGIDDHDQINLVLKT